MLKMIGALLILGASTWFGFYLAGTFSRRPAEIRHLQNGLQLLETEIVYGATPLIQALKKTGSLIGPPVGTIFLTASRKLEGNDGESTFYCWKEAVEEAWPATAMKTTEKEILLGAGQALGRTDRMDQKKHLRLAIQHLEREGEQAREEQNQYEKMCKSLGFLGGMLVALLMM
ncbi:MAG: stage III sporulation protein AB [Bacillaceae bacterium]|nr:stage III sporulation protein AB [Bacillaceae bacterium]